jgi:DNA polymerase III epsilon subunit family exonuclease
VDLKKNIEEFNLVFLDLETTGLDAVWGDSICEIGALKIKGGETVGEFHTLVNPRKAIPYEAYLIHKISNEEVKDAPYFKEVADKLLLFLQGCVICGYNVEFDIGFIQAELRRINYPSLQVPAIDILSMAKRTLQLPRYNLRAIATFLNLNIRSYHRALDDALLASKVFLKLKDILREKGIKILENYISLYGINNNIFKFQEEQKVTLLKEAIDKGLVLKMRYFSYNSIVEEKKIKPINLSREQRHFYLWYQSKKEGSRRINLNRILDITLSS